MGLPLKSSRKLPTNKLNISNKLKQIQNISIIHGEFLHREKKKQINVAHAYYILET